MAYDNKNSGEKSGEKSGHYTMNSYYSKCVKEANSASPMLAKESAKKVSANTQLGPKKG